MLVEITLQLNEDLLKKQQELDAKQTELENKELSINGLNNELKVRMLKVKELENIIDELVDIAQSKGIDVYVSNGKVIN